jgi:DNA helicase-2/ATP-dependent DNA helicase PcrA
MSEKIDEMVPSEQKAKIFDVYKTTRFNIGIEATAGSGKTTTLLQLLKFTPPLRRTIFLSFANAIVEELATRVPNHIKASTLHSVGAGIIMKTYGALPLVEDKYFKKAMVTLTPAPKETRQSKPFFRKCYEVQDIATYLRITLCDLEYDAGEQMCKDYDLNYSEQTLKQAIKLVSEDKMTNMDFTDMLYVPASRPELVVWKYDNVFLDEAQDCNQAGIKLVESLLKPDTGRLVFCGDSNQCIYSFIGSDLQTFDYLKSRSNTVNLPLSMSYRCSKAVVRLAQRVFPAKSEYIAALPDAPEGWTGSGDFSDVEPGDMIICRTNKPLFEAYFNLIDRGIKSHFIGKDIEKGIVQLAEKCMAPIKSRFEANLEAQLVKLEKELAVKGVRNIESHSRYVALTEKIELLLIVAEKVQTIKELIPTIHEIFTPQTKGVRLLTGHRSKGLENDRVFLINQYDGKTLCPSSKATTQRERLAELNIMFVMITRAKRDLVFLSL